MDLSEFYDTFFEEAEELLNDMEAQLLAIDPEQPDSEQLNAIFRDAHSIKGGAGTFGFEALQHTTHLLENLLDYARRGELKLRRDLVDTFLETKDIMHDQLDAYRQGGEPDPEAVARICAVLQKLAAEEVGDGKPTAKPATKAAAKPAKSKKAAKKTDKPATKAAAKAEPVATPAPEAVAAVPAASASGAGSYRVVLLGVSDKDRALLIDELAHLGDVTGQSGDATRCEIAVDSTSSADDIEAVLCFVVEPGQIQIEAMAEDDAVADAEDEDAAADATDEDAFDAADTAEPDAAVSVNDAELVKQPVAAVATGAVASRAAAQDSATSAGKHPSANHDAHAASASSSIRVPVNKVDQIINLVGELIITQSMLNQVAGQVTDDGSGKLQVGISLLERNARDLQEAVMSVRMVPMDYVFSRFPRLVRDLASKLDKDVELVTRGRSTELDKSLTERIIDPLTHLVRNSLDHGIEHPDDREAAGKPRTGTLTLSAEHRGGSIAIEVSDDGAGMDRERILAKARERGLVVSDGMSDGEVWNLIFAPGLSTAKTVSDVSGRGVGMDVVKRNIEAMGGHVEIRSKLGEGSTICILLPLTLAILEGMLVRVGKEMFILPVTAVIESLQPRKEDLYAMGGGERLLKVREDYLPLVAVNEIMCVDGAVTDPVHAIAVVVQAHGRRYAILVDDLVGQQQVVVKNLETNYRKVPGISAATIMGDGSVALILDINGLQQLGHISKSGPVNARPIPVSDLEAEPA